jgi:single-strand DNA-binding protein
MALPYVQATGNLTRDPELTFTQSGAARLRITLACNNRYLDKTSNEWKDGEPTYVDVTIWREMAENVADSLTKGDPVTVVGRLKQRKWEQDGQTRTAFEVDADSVSVDLRRRKVNVKRVERGQALTVDDSQWTTSDDLPPF